MFPDGHEVPLETAYTGQAADGCHRWVATVPIRVQERGQFIIRCGLPSDTVVAVLMEIPAGLVPFVRDVTAHADPNPPPWRRAPGGDHN